MVLPEELVQADALHPRHLDQGQDLFADLQALLMPGELHQIRKIMLG